MSFISYIRKRFNGTSWDTYIDKGTIAAIYPVGSVYISTLSTNPATLFGFGTWSSFAQGRALVGLDAADTDWDTVEETRGAKTATLTQDNLPNVNFPVMTNNLAYNTSITSGATSSALRMVFDSVTAEAPGGGGQLVAYSGGSGTGHSNIQPSVVVYMWKRTA